MEIVRSLNRSWIYDTYFTYIELFIRGECPGGMSGGNVRIKFKICKEPEQVTMEMTFQRQMNYAMSKPMQQMKMGRIPHANKHRWLNLEYRSTPSI